MMNVGLNSECLELEKNWNALFKVEKLKSLYFSLQGPSKGFVDMTVNYPLVNTIDSQVSRNPTHS
jgi:hypothetical protein